MKNWRIALGYSIFMTTYRRLITKLGVNYVVAFVFLCMREVGNFDVGICFFMLFFIR